MKFGIFVLLTALSISAVAAYYSIIGLMAIFAAAAVPIAIMGVVLEIGKLVTASWLYQFWARIPKFLKYYLTIAVVVLMFITSMGIFGFLSKAHVEQTSNTTQAEAKVERIDEKINRFTGRVNVTKDKIDRLQSKDHGQHNTNIAAAIEQQEEIRDGAWGRVSSSISQENQQIRALRAQLEKDISIQEQRVSNAIDRVRDDVAVKQQAIERINQQLAQLDKEVQAYVDKGVEKKNWGNSIDWIKRGKELREKQKPEREALAFQIREVEQEIDSIRQDEIAVSNEVQVEITTLREALAVAIRPHQNKIAQLRENTQTEIDDANTQIKQLQEQMGMKADEVETKVNELEVVIEDYYTQIDTLKEQRFVLATEVRQLEVEVGPIKYIAGLVYLSLIHI